MDSRCDRPCTANNLEATQRSGYVYLPRASATTPNSDVGPIVRIGPNEATYFYEPFKTGPSSTFQTAEPREHSTLRRLISKPFSKKSVLEFEPHIWESIDTLSTVLRQNSETNTFFDLSKMSRCLSLDFITKFTYGESTEAVKSPDFHEDILDAFDSFSISNFLFMMMPSLRTPSISLLSKLPFKVFQAIPKMRQQVQDALEMYEKSAKFGAVTGFQPLLQSEHTTSLTQNHPLDKDFLIADGISHVFAGTDTTSTTLTLTLIEIFTNPNIYDRLHAELKQAIPNSNETAQLSNLENLPFLTACVKVGEHTPSSTRAQL
ncbi:hypothetical protein EIK77_006539 [Talaromyces pinophilus]|nr:hypothetical protein EIK77_006539 [Talaromyces pinophilus]